MHYLAKKILELPVDERQKLMSELVDTELAPPVTIADKNLVVPMLDFTEEAKERANNFGKMQGVSSGYRSIDRLTKGFVGGELTIVAGKTSYGKTTLAMNICNQMVLRGGRALFVTMEMTHVELTSRFMHINGGPDTEDYSVVAANTVFQRNDELTWQDIDGLIENAIRQLGVTVVFIDHLHYFTREIDSRLAEDLGRITKEFKKNAIRHDIPVLLISHVRKTGQDTEASIEDLRGSSYIGQDADIVLMVGRRQDEQNVILVKIEKNRNRGYDYSDNIATLRFDQTKITEQGNLKLGGF